MFTGINLTQNSMHKNLDTKDVLHDYTYTVQKQRRCKQGVGSQVRGYAQKRTQKILISYQCILQSGCLQQGHVHS